jgi:hypothetical protein
MAAGGPVTEVKIKGSYMNLPGNFFSNENYSTASRIGKYFTPERA